MTVFVRSAIPRLMSLSSASLAKNVGHVCHFPLSPSMRSSFTFPNSDDFAVDRVSTVWVPEVRHWSPSKPILLVGITGLGKPKEIKNKNDNVFSLVSRKEGKAKAREVGAYRYIQCDLSSVPSVNRVFQESVRAYRDYESKLESPGCLLQ